MKLQALGSVNRMGSCLCTETKFEGGGLSAREAPLSSLKLKENTMENDVRAEIRRLISQNRAQIGPELVNFFARTCQDLCAGGLDADAVLDGAFTAAVVLKIASCGAPETIKFLRTVADVHEGLLRNGPFPEESRH